jgi:hypothetical protein
MTKQLNILSLGAGVQSTAVLLMSCLGELPKVDCAIFADTCWEPEEVYLHLDWLSDFARRHGIDVHDVEAGNIRKDAVSDSRSASLPYFTLGADGTRGMVRRQCTNEYKIEPVNKFIRKEILGLDSHQPIPPNTVRLWFGISSDEWQRMRTSSVKWREHYYPLVENKITRYGCLEWMRIRKFPLAPRSACIGCPYHSDFEWREMIKHRPKQFEDACQFDESIRNLKGLDEKAFLHRSCVPLREVDFRTDFDKGQLPLFSPECDGFHCMSE